MNKSTVFSLLMDCTPMDGCDKQCYMHTKQKEFAGDLVVIEKFVDQLSMEEIFDMTQYHNNIICKLEMA